MDNIKIYESFDSEDKFSVTKAPDELPQDGRPGVFLAGSIEMGKAEDWQAKVEKLMKHENVAIYNPRRDDWDCVDSETKAITKAGIKSYNELTLDDLIMSFNQEKNVLEYVPILKLNIYEVDTHLMRFKRNDTAEFLFTHNHKHISRKSSRNNSYDFYDSSIFKNGEGRVRIPTGLKLELEPSGKLIPEGDTYLDDHFRLAAWILSEGSIFNRSDSVSMVVVIAQYIINKSKVSRIKKLLDRLEINYRYDDRQFMLGKDAVNFILGILEIKKYEIPDWIKVASPEQKLIFIEEYGFGDGCYVNEQLKYIAFSEKYRKFAEDIQILTYEAGISSKLREKTSGFGFPVVNVNLHNKNKKSYSLTYHDDVEYKGIVWCPTTHNNTWVAYRNGTPFITGNSSWEQSMENDKFREQVNWELDALDRASVIIMYFAPETKSPISLLELGLHAQSGKMVVCCPEGFWRKGNVDVTCAKYSVPTYPTIEETIAAAIVKIKSMY